MLKENKSEEQTGAENRMESPYRKEQAAVDARYCLLGSAVGYLTTIVRPGHELDGYPMPSVTPYIIDRGGNLVILIGDIAEHTKNAAKTTKSSMIIHQSGKGLGAQFGWRLAVVGDIAELTGEEADEVGDKYYRLFPEAIGFHKVHQFSFWRLTPKKFRFIKGPGEISWLAAGTVVPASPFSREVESRVIEHMNADHVDALRTYLAQQDVALDKKAAGHEIEPVMVSLNQYGFAIRYGLDIHFIKFPQELNTAEEVHHTMIAMLRG